MPCRSFPALHLTALQAATVRQGASSLAESHTSLPCAAASMHLLSARDRQKMSAQVLCCNKKPWASSEQGALVPHMPA